MSDSLSFTYSDNPQNRLRQYDLLLGELTAQLPNQAPPRNEALRLAARQKRTWAEWGVQLYLPWQTPLNLSIPQFEIRLVKPDLEIARKYKCRTITTLLIIQTALELQRTGQVPIGDLAEFAFSEFSVWVPERSLPLLRLPDSELALSLSTADTIESSRVCRTQHIHLAAHEYERCWFSDGERRELQQELLFAAKHGLETGTNIRLKDPEFRYDVASDSLFYAGYLGNVEVLELIGRLQRGEAQACYVWAPTGISHPLLHCQRLDRFAFSLLRGFQTMQLAGPVWEVRLADQTDNHKTP